MYDKISVCTHATFSLERPHKRTYEYGPAELVNTEWELEKKWKKVATSHPRQRHILKCRVTYHKSTSNRLREK